MVKLYFILFFFVFYSFESNAQDIFGYNNSIKYIQFLNQEKNYTDAYSELIKLKQTGSNDTNYVKLVLTLIGRVENANKADIIREYLPFSKNEDVFNLILCNSLLIDSFALAHEALKFQNSKSQFYNDFVISCLLLEKNYDSAKNYINSNNIDLPFISSINSSINNKKKHKSIGIILSTIIPGAGKAYYNQYIDGFTALFTTSTYLFLTYSTLKSDGPKNIFPWINAGAFGLFYIGNIVGTSSAHERYYNKIDINIRKIIIPEIEKIYSTY